MDTRIAHHAAIVTDWLNEFVNWISNGKPSDYELVIDDVHHQYQVIRTGWQDDIFDFAIIFHLQIKPTGKVWLLVNNTDLLVFDDLVERGIPKSDLVIGFLPEAMRPYSGFAVT